MSETIENIAYQRALGYLFERIDYERTPPRGYRPSDFKLDRMRRLLTLLKRPDENLPIVHVAGTKGKGSTAAMIASMLTAAGYKTGLYTSPHLDRVEERMAVDGFSCSAGEFISLVDQVAEASERLCAEDGGCSDRPPTYFELTTAMALCHFANRHVDIAVLEVGMGGRLDSTNVCRPAVTVITSISYDHTKHLGKTLAAIAAEKAGIVKPGIPLISGVRETEPRDVLVETARRVGAPLLELNRDFHVRYDPPREIGQPTPRGVIHYRDDEGRVLSGVPLGLLGAHQADNAAVALATIGQLVQAGWRMDDTSQRKGLGRVTCPARVEVVSHRPLIAIDAAHNLASIDALLQTLDTELGRRRSLLVFATTRDKDARGMLRRLLPRFDRVILTRYTNNPRGVPPEELDRLASEISHSVTTICPNPTSACEQIRGVVGDEDLVCITGSFFIAAEMRHQIDRRPLRASANRVGESLSAGPP